VNQKIPTLEDPPYSPGLAPCDFFSLIPKIKSALKGTRFKSVDALKAVAMEAMKKLSRNDPQHGFQHWKIHMEQCRGWERDHSEADNISIM
jgi:hypothetical protein